MGRAVRSSPRDAMLSHPAGQTGLGWGFGLHQALDQTGAVIGPLVVSGILFLGHGYCRSSRSGARVDFAGSRGPHVVPAAA
jgi:hypothetical protein